MFCGRSRNWKNIIMELLEKKKKNTDSYLKEPKFGATESTEKLLNGQNYRMRFQAEGLVLEIRATQPRLKLPGSANSAWVRKLCCSHPQCHLAGLGLLLIIFWAPGAALKSANWTWHWWLCRWNIWYTDFLIGTVKCCFRNKYKATHKMSGGSELTDNCIRLRNSREKYSLEL